MEQTTSNALRVLTALGCPEIPVHRGAVKPFCRSAVHAPEYHGETGLDGSDRLPEAQALAIERPNAVLAMRDAIMSDPEKGTFLVATGALTNVALLFATFPETVSRVKGLSIMGGGIGQGFTEVTGLREGGGNWTEWAEFNIYVREQPFAQPMLEERLTIVTSATPKLHSQFSRM